MAQPDAQQPDPRVEIDSVNPAPAPDAEARPAPIDDMPVPPLTEPADTKGG